MSTNNRAHHHNILYYDGLLTNKSLKAGMVHVLLVLCAVFFTETFVNNEGTLFGYQLNQAISESAKNSNEEVQCCNGVAYTRYSLK